MRYYHYLRSKISTQISLVLGGCTDAGFKRILVFDNDKKCWKVHLSQLSSRTWQAMRSISQEMYASVDLHLLRC